MRMKYRLKTHIGLYNSFYYPLAIGDFCSLLITVGNGSALDQARRNIGSSPRTVSGHYQPASETRFKWRFTGVPIVAFFEIISGEKS